MTTHKHSPIAITVAAAFLFFGTSSLMRADPAQADQEVFENIYLSESGSSARTLIAVGYGRCPTRPGYSKTQEKLMALRAARLDAYRKLTAAMNEVSLRESTSMTLDGYIRGAFLIREQSLGNNRYSVEIGMPLHDADPQIANRLKTYKKDLSSQKTALSYEEWKDWSK